MYDTDEWHIKDRIEKLKQVRKERSDEDFMEELTSILKEIVEAIPKHYDPSQE